jgi:hypothetical protein
VTKDEALKLALKFVEDSEGGTADLEAHIREALAQPEQEPVGKFAKFTDGIWREVTDGSAGAPLYTSPPQRTWVWLTDDDKEEIKRQASYHWEMTVGEYADEVQRFTISKLKEKNT